MKILILTQFFPPEFGACAARNSEHAALWARAGHEVYVCTGFPNYPAGVISEEYRGKWFEREERDGYAVLRSWIYVAENRSLWKRLAASFSFMTSAALSAALKCPRPDIIIASSGPFFVGPLGYVLSLLKWAPFVFEVRDLLPQQAIDVGMVRNPLVIRLLYAMEEFLYARARGVVAVAEASRQSLTERGIPESKCFTIENGIREGFFAPGAKENAVRDEYGWNGRFVAMYIGAHGVSQGLYALLDAAELLKDRPDILFVFVGDGAEKPGLLARARERGLDNVQFLPLQPKERMPLFYAASDVCLVPLRKGKYFEINIPSKIFEILACERPILLGAAGQARRIVEASGGGLAVNAEDTQGYVEALVKLYEQPGLREELGRQGRAYAVAECTRARKAARYLTILEELVGRSR